MRPLPLLFWLHQLTVLRNARLTAAAVVMFEGREIPLKEHHVVVTMNPGYAGRTELPNNLQVGNNVIPGHGTEISTMVPCGMRCYQYASATRL